MTDERVNELALLEARALIDAKVGSAVHLQHERDRILELLEPGERVIDAESVALGFHADGMLAITDRRLIHLRFRHTLRRFSLFVCEYDRLDRVDVQTLWSSARLLITYDEWRQVFFMAGKPTVADALERTGQLRDEIIDAAGMTAT